MAVPFLLQRPTLQSAGFFDSFGEPRQPLGIDDLYQPPPAMGSYPDAPSSARSLRDLSEEERKRVRQRAILQAALAFAAPGGRTGEALAQAAAGSQEFEQASIDTHNQQAGRDYDLARRRYDEDQQRSQQQYAQAGQRRDAENRLALYKRISEQDPELAPEAEGAARSNDEKRLQALLEAIPRREAERKMGYDPADPFVGERVKSHLDAEEAALKRKAVLEGLPEELKIRNTAELEALDQKLKMQRESSLSERAEMARRGLLWKPDSDGTGAAGEAAKRKWAPDIRTLNGRTVMVDRNQVGPDGMPKIVDMGPAVTHKQHYKDANGGQWIFDPLAGTSVRDKNFDESGNPIDPNQKKTKYVWFWEDGFNKAKKTTTATAPAPKPGSGAIPQGRPSPMVDNPRGLPAAGRGQGPLSPLAPKPRAAAGAPAGGGGATAKLNAVTDPQKRRQIEAARGHYSDEEIAAYLGVQ